MWKFNPFTNKLDFIGSTVNILTAYPPGSQQLFNGETIARATGGVALAAGLLYYFPIKLEADATFESITVRAGSAGAPVGSFILGIYEINSTYTGSLLFQSIAGDTSITTQTLSNPNLTLKAGYYILAWNADTAYTAGGRESGLNLFGNDVVNTSYRFAHTPHPYTGSLPANMIASPWTYISVGNTPHVGFNLIN